MVALGQRRKGRNHEAYGNIGTVTDLSKQRQALIEHPRRLFWLTMNQCSKPQVTQGGSGPPHVSSPPAHHHGFTKESY
jgi:hypothetical protein